MPDAKVRMQIALLAARLMYSREESEYFTAKRKAARQLGVDSRHHPKDLPSNAEIREQILALANLYEGSRRQDNLRDMRMAALRMMRLLSAFHPRLIGSTLTGHIRQGSDIDLHVFANTSSGISTLLEDAGFPHTLERKQVRKHGEERTFTHIHLTAHTFNFELTLYETDKINYGFKSSITGKLIERASLPELEAFLTKEYPGVDLSFDSPDSVMDDDERYSRFRALLVPLEHVQQNPAYHPEGDALYHSLQVFELARDRVPWDEEFLLAALLHDVGKGIDRHNHVEAGLEALDGLITERTAFLIEHHMEAHQLADQTLGHRAKVRLQASEHYEDVLLLQELDQAGRRRGAQVPTVDAALGYIRELASDPW